MDYAGPRLVMNLEFPAAPWGARIKLVTFLLLGLLLVVFPVVFLFLPEVSPAGASLVLGFTALILGIVALFVVRGFRLSEDRLLIRRSFWETAISLDGLESVEMDPRACERAWKMAGNDGLFAMHGWFRSKRLGRFRAFVTDPASSVVLRFAGGKVVVVSPERPRRFTEELNRRLSRAEGRR